MSLFLRFILLMVLSGFAYAGTPVETDMERALREGGFYLATEIPEKPKNFQNAVDATVRIGSCTGIILSPDGYVATNIHCISQCFKKAWDFTPNIDIERIEKNHYFDILKINEQIPKNFKCQEHINRQLTIYEYQLSNPKIVWLGRGKQTHNEENIILMTDKQVKAIANSYEDVAILKYEKHSSSPKKLPCLPIAKKKSTRDDTVWALGFPSHTKRRSRYNSNGANMYISVGKVRNRISADPIYKGYTKSYSKKQAKKFWQRESLIWDRPSLMLSSLDAYHGNSGGPIVDKNGKLQALLFSIAKSSFDEYNAATTFGLNAEHIFKQIASQMGQATAEKIFNCK